MRKKKSRRTYGTGTVSVNRTIERYTVIWYGIDGKKHSCSKFPLTKEGKEQAEEFLKQQNQNKDDKIGYDSEMQLAQWIAKKLEADELNLRNSTMRLKYTIAKSIGEYGWDIIKLPIQDITPTMVQQMYIRMQNSDVANSYIQRIHNLLHQTFAFAVKMHAVRYNMLDFVECPKSKRKKIQIFEGNEIYRMFRWFRKYNAKFHDYYLYFSILLYTGMRIGELIALQYSDIDFDRREINVQRTASNNSINIEEPKTKAGNRLIPIISDRLLSMLKQARKDHPANTYVLESKNHTRITYTNIHVLYTKMKAETGITKNIHCFRHTFATRMLAASVPILEVARILGHSRASITLDLYGHAIPSYNQRIIEMFKRKRN